MLLALKVWKQKLNSMHKIAVIKNNNIGDYVTYYDRMKFYYAL